MSNKITVFSVNLPCGEKTDYKIFEQVVWSKEDPVLSMIMKRTMEKYKDHCDVCNKGDKDWITSIGEYDVDEEAA